MMKTLLAIVAFFLFTGSAQAFTISWTVAPEPDVAEYRLYRAPTSCATVLPGQFKLAKTFGVVNQGTYTPPFRGVWCFQLKAVDKAGNVSKRSNRVTKTY
jgi:hypothetical protein